MFKLQTQYIIMHEVEMSAHGIKLWEITDTWFAHLHAADVLACLVYDIYHAVFFMNRAEFRAF
jgi:hypothetical protein